MNGPKCKFCGSTTAQFSITSPHGFGKSCVDCDEIVREVLEDQKRAQQATTDELLDECGELIDGLNGLVDNLNRNGVAS